MMKNFTLYFCLLICTFSVFSCSDPCEDVTCGENGTCEEGSCQCDEGYDGNQCENLIISKYFGLWKSTNLECDGTEQEQVTIQISGGLDANSVIIFFPNNSSVFLLGIYGKITDTNLNIPSQKIFDFEKNSTIEGSGIFSSNELILTYNSISDFGTKVCTGNFFKQ